MNHSVLLSKGTAVVKIDKVTAPYTGSVTLQVPTKH